MLILSRRVNEVICIGDDVKIVVLGLKGHQVRLGIDAPEEVVVDREEIAIRKRQEREALDSLTATEGNTK